MVALETLIRRWLFGDDDVPDRTPKEVTDVLQMMRTKNPNDGKYKGDIETLFEKALHRDDLAQMDEDA